MPHAAKENGKKSFPSLSASLGVKGDLRVRPYGNVKHAHLILRKVDEEDYVDSKGVQRRRAIFSFFAQKLINVKPGKELYLYLQPANGDVKEVPIAFEADLTGPGDEQSTHKEENVLSEIIEVKKEALEVEVREQAVPPKMRKAWLKKQESSSSIQMLPSPVTVAVTSKNSVGVQTHHETNSVEIQTLPYVPSHISNGARVSDELTKIPTDTTAVVASTAGGSSQLLRSASRYKTKKKSIDRSQSIDLSSTTGEADDFKSRSLSPMDIESPATTPPESPQISKEFLDDSNRRKKSLSPLYSPKADSHEFLPGVDVIHNEVFTDTLRPSSSSRFDQKAPVEGLFKKAKSSQVPAIVNNEPKVKATPMINELQTAYNELQAMLKEQETHNSDEVVATKKPLHGFVRATLPSSTLSLTDISPTLESKELKEAPIPSQISVNSKSKGFVSSFVPVTNDSIAKKSRTTFTKRHEPRRTQTDTSSTSPNSHLYSTAQYSPSSPSMNSIASSSKITVDRIFRPTDTKPPTPLTTPTLKPATSPILGPPATHPPVISPTLASNRNTTPSPITMSVAQFACTSITPSIDTPNNPAKLQSSAHFNGSSHVPSESPFKPNPATFKVKQEMLSPTLPPLDLPVSPDEGEYDPASGLFEQRRRTPNFDGILQENGFDHLPISVVHAADPNYVSDETEFELPPPRPVPQPRFDSNGVKQEPIDIPLSFNDFVFQNNSTEFSSPKNSDSYQSPIYTPIPAKPYVPQKDGSLKRRRVDSVDSDDDVSKRRCPFRRVYTGQIRFDFGSGIRDIFFNYTGSHFAVICYDHTIRVWNNRSKVEIAKLTHNAPVITALWVRDSLGLVSLGLNGVVNRWTCSTQNQWQWSRLLDTGDVEPSGMDYRNDRIAIAFPRVGVRLWVLINGYWQQQRTIRTVHVLAVKFIGRGETILCACADGRLWRGFVHDGGKEVCHVTRTKIFGLDLDLMHRHVVITEAGGKAHVLTITPHGQKFTVNNLFGTKDIESRRKVIHPFGALFASRNNLIVFGSIGDGIFVWNKTENSMISELSHGDNVLIQAVANLDEEGGMTCLLTGSKEGRLSRWIAPASLFDGIKAEPSWKRPRVEF